MPTTLLSIALGAAVGAILRFALAEGLNQVFPTLPMGTLAANLLGGFLMGITLAAVVAFPNLPPQWRLFITTGFLGGLTTFSTFSAESFLLLQRSQYSASAVHMLTHVFGALACTAAGFALGRLVIRG